MEPVIVHPGDRPLILSFPYVCTYLPDEVAERLNEKGRVLRGTEWQIEEFYFHQVLGLKTVAATECAQSSRFDTQNQPFTLDPARIAALRLVLGAMLQPLADLAPSYRRP